MASRLCRHCRWSVTHHLPLHHESRHRWPALKRGRTASLAASLSATPTVTAMPPPAAADALAWILYTSSTTGRPKGVMQTRANIFLYAAQVTEGLSLGPADRLLVASPLHLHAGATLSLAALLS